ncbi:MAG TPA: class I SAM-dependent rRNA methyltransferase [Syntrophorhabdaceae bacterium]|nr:class I SAM-dependent rRNA methyltransferase [Syntrophorhabdaceae bacterium]HOL06082.1 class I SAM-dependent rRNA methyltransferase [Syntrophorhabdaceae bacterium]HPP42530.1 class I SAM-dependent rRNA methyltransferase [Syntrophorhabdaceae bacterium]HRR72566.1 class I SAM-dependent rRNA methyltransferase [Syntrophorhabdaceae bacterium]HRV23291.1 class I SAM-dependent rRNA methyltransferase [Syntrophorhabdaceae bacterium]
MEQIVSLTVNQDRIGPIKGFHPWVFSRAIKKIPDGLVSGQPVKLYDEHHVFLAQGYFNSYSQIAIRIWGYDEQEKMDSDFFKKRIDAAYRIRNRYIASPETDAFRLINGESDLLPGLIVDKYGEYLVVQFHTRGIEAWRDKIIESLYEVISPIGIYERSDMPVRETEGLSKANRLLFGEVPDFVEIKENSLKFLVDIRHGQKTGFFLDQRDKRKAFTKYAKDALVLNCFSYTGGFSVYAMAGGAKGTINVDTSADALELARENIRINGFNLDTCRFIRTDAKEYLKSCEERFDAVVLDPPAFIKDRRKMNEGKIGYKGLNELAMGHINGGGILLTCSCSAHLGLEDFRYILSEAAGRAHRSFKILETYTHGIDHPQLVPFTEGSYLKCLILCL